MEEKVDILIPPTFQKSGMTKTRTDAWKDGDWIGTFNLWIVQENPDPSMIYQLRSLSINYAPNKLDVAVGGHYKAGENMSDGLREAKEELGKSYNFSDLTPVGRRIHVALDERNLKRLNIVDIFFITDNSPLSSFKLQKEEVQAVFSLPIKELIKVHADKNYSFQARGLDNSDKEIVFTVKSSSFPYNFDKYHYKMALLAKRFLNGDKHLIY